MPTANMSVALDQLILDPDNPRLPTTVSRDQSTMLTYIAKTSSITELMTAIGQHGYFPGEPLIVIPDAKKGQYIVVEGNRRLTALRLLQNPRLSNSGPINAAASEAIHRPTSVPCIVFDTRSEIINYLGYRHITGIKQWEPLAKARYIAQYYDNETDPALPPTDRYKIVARSIGSRPTYIKRQLDGVAVFRRMETHDFFEIDDLDEENIPFSILTTALGYESVLKFVSKTTDPYAEPKKLKRSELKELSAWMFEKDSNGETRLGDSRNLKKLAIILESEPAIKELRDGASIDDAYTKTRGLQAEFSEVLVSVEQSISQAVAMVAVIEVDSRQSQKIKNIRKQAVALDRLSASGDDE